MCKKVIVALSGGVDSSVVAFLLNKKKMNVTGIFMKNWEEDDIEENCSAQIDINDAESICKLINIPFKKINFSYEYWEQVFKVFLYDYKKGEIPNPDILCNKEIKFKMLLEYSIKYLKNEYLATGHYVRKKKLSNGKYQLLKAIDLNKDQSYFLYTLNQQQLKHLYFPLGNLTKDKVRMIAKNNNLHNFNKKDSTGICFIGEKNMKNFLSKYLSCDSGKIYNTNNIVIGKHYGAIYYTIGQRKGLKIGGIKNYLEEPWFVAKKDIKNNIIIAVQGHNHPLLFRKSIKVRSVHWIEGEPINKQFKCSAKIRYRQNDQNCIVSIINNNTLYVRFQNKQRGINIGQSIVFYQDIVCLGGGIIQE